MKQAASVDLFCGCGGLSYGMKQAGVQVCAGIDIDPSCRHPYEANVGARFYEMVVRDLGPEFLRSLFPRNAHRILAGCAPCQPFSCYSRNEKSDKWNMLSVFGHMIDGVLPDVITMENVPGVAGTDVFDGFLQVLRRNGYHHVYDVLDCSRYGIPQTRRRLVLLASRLGRIGMPRRDAGSFTVRDAIGHIEKIPAGGTSTSDRLHRSSSLSDLNMRRIKSSKPGGTWRDWDPELVTACHGRSTGKTYPGVYGRMEWDRPAPTITTQFHGFGSGRFGHPEQDRALSLREGALLQTFPEEYSFVSEQDDVEIKTVSRMIGNAVPVKLGIVIGRHIIRHLREHHG